MSDQSYAMLAVRVGRAVQDGRSSLSIQLHPAELGRVEVHLSFHSEGVGIQITMDRRETYDAFTRDRLGLTQQLTQAGIDLGNGGLDLRFGQQSAQSHSDGATTGTRFATAIQPPPSASRSAPAFASDSLVDILA